MEKFTPFKDVKQKIFGKRVGVYAKWNSAGRVVRLTFISYRPEVVFRPLDLDLSRAKDRNTNFDCARDVK